MPQKRSNPESLDPASGLGNVNSPSAIDRRESTIPSNSHQALRRRHSNAEARSQAADALDKIHDLCATAAGYAVSIERCAEQGSTARFAFELRQILACLSERVESLNRARKPEGAQ
jgi:hypothetical protein